MGKNYKIIFVADSQMEGVQYYNDGLKVSGPGGVSEGLDEIWLMRYVWDIFDPGDRVRQKVEERGYKKVDERNFNGVIVWRYKHE